MKKTMKRLLALLLIAALCFTALPAASAELSGTCGEDAFWVLSDDGTLTIFGTGLIWNPDLGVDRLTGLTTSLVIEAGITEIAEATFGGYTKLERVSLPDTLTVIGEYAFGQCIALSDIELPNSLESIGRVAFMGCTSLDTLTIPRNVSSIGARICDTASIAVDGNNRYFSSENGILFNKNKTSLLLYPERGSAAYVVPSSVKTIGASAFSSCVSLKTLTIPASVTKIETQAFAQAGLQEIVFFGSKPSFPKAPNGDNSNAFQNVWADVYVPNGKNWSTTSQYGGTLTWHVETAPTIRSQPQNITANEGTTASFSLTASGTDLNYQWQVSTNGTSWADVTDPACGGAQTAALTVPAAAERSGNRYRCVISNHVGDVTSNAVKLTVRVKPVILTQPLSVTELEDAPVSFAVTATGDDLSYAWQRKAADGEEWTDIDPEEVPSAATETLTLSATRERNGEQYRCIVTNAAGSAVSESALLTVKLKPTIQAQPESVKASVGTAAVFTVTASGEELSYQWQYTSNGVSWANVTNAACSGMQTEALTVPAITARNGFQYRCVVTNEAGSAVSEGATLTVPGKPSLTEQPASVTAMAGTAAVFTVTASGEELSYQWQYSTNGVSWANVTNAACSGMQTEMLTVPAITARNGFQYRCKVTNAGGSVYSDAAILSVTAKPNITTQPASVTAAAGTTVKFTVTAIGENLSYQWQYSTNGTSWANVTNTACSGMKTNTLTVPAILARNGYQYRCKVTNAAGSVTSSAATLTVTGKPVITKQPASVTAAAGTTVKFTVTASGSNLSYQWQTKMSSDGNWVNVTNAACSGMKTATLTVPAIPARNGYQYRCVVTNGDFSATSQGATLTVTD